MSNCNNCNNVENCYGNEIYDGCVKSSTDIPYLGISASDSYKLVTEAIIEKIQNLSINPNTNKLQIQFGFKNIESNEKDGLLVEPDDPKALACAIKRVIKDEPFRNELAIHGLNSYIQKFSMERHVTSVFDFLNNLDQSFDKK